MSGAEFSCSSQTPHHPKMSSSFATQQMRELSQAGLQQKISFVDPTESETFSASCRAQSPTQRHKRRTSRRSKLLFPHVDAEEGNDCDGNFTTSGTDPEKNVGPLGRQHDHFAKYAPCGHWATCSKDNCGEKKYFETCATCPTQSN
jgi:hypothetical protein